MPHADTPQERDDKATDLAKDVRRFKFETRVLYVISVGLAVACFSLYDRLQDAQDSQASTQRGLVRAQRDLADTQQRVVRLVAQIQSERKRNTGLACRQRNTQNLALTGFIRSTVPPEQASDPRVKVYLARADKAFPQVNCKQQAKQRVKSTPLVP